MSAQNCQARALFKTCKITIDYNYEIIETNPNAPDFDFDITFKGKYESDLFCNFTKREVSCGNLLAHKKQKLQNQNIGWAHKGLDSKIVRDFSAGYPFPTAGTGIGYAYPTEYYASQKYPNQKGYKKESIPLIEKIRNRQEFIPLYNGRHVYDDPNNGFNLPHYLGPFYYKIEDSDDPLFGYPPNFPDVLEENQWVLFNNKTVFESKDKYSKWLNLYLSELKSPIYFPNAPNDPEKNVVKRKLPTLFSTESAWLEFYNSAGGKGIDCGGNSQCGINFYLPPSSDGSGIILTLNLLGQTASGEYTQIPSSYNFEQLDKDRYSISPFQTIEKDENGKFKLDLNGNVIWKPWQQFNDITIQNSRFAFQLIDVDKFGVFNIKQKGCKELKNQISLINENLYSTDYQLNSLLFCEIFENDLDKFINIQEAYPGQFWSLFLLKIDLFNFQTIINVLKRLKTVIAQADNTKVDIERVGRIDEPSAFGGVTSYRLAIKYTIEYEDL